MKVIGLDKRNYTIQVSNFIVYDNDTRQRSSLHLRARNVIKEVYPCATILEEVTLPGSRSVPGKNLIADFLLPLERVLIEVHGEQHYKYVNHFHGSNSMFIESKKRDREKIEWCNINNIFYVEFPNGESDDEWRARLR